MADDTKSRNRHAVNAEVAQRYFECLLDAEQSNDPFPLDFDDLWSIAYANRSSARRALIDSQEFSEGEDYRIQAPLSEESTVLDGTVAAERIVLSMSCAEFFIARKARLVFDYYRQCRQLITQAL